MWKSFWSMMVPQITQPKSLMNSQRDSRIICIHKENGGVSSARNAGLKIATGEYVTFIDGDDWVEPNYISYLLELVEKIIVKSA